MASVVPDAQVPDVQVREFFTDKCVLMTGVTGFLGKVLLEKFLRTVPRIGKIYILIRDKPKYTHITLAERLRKEIFDSKVFQPLFQERPEILKVIKERVIPVKGDLVQEGLGIESGVRETLIKELQIIFNNAERIQQKLNLGEALKCNYFGARRILDLANECENMIAMHHVSTAYVNTYLSNNSYVYEEILPFPNVPDWEIWVEKIIKMDPEMLEIEEP